LKRLDVLLTVLVVLLAAVCAWTMFLDYYAHPEFLWRGDPSDRNEHFTLGLRLAIAARNLDLDWYLYLLEFAKLWPPFHGIVLSMVLLVGGLDVRLGIVPSLFGWIITITMTWVIARSYFQDAILSFFASSIATTFAIASPLFRLLATDVMLECLGAALRLWCFIHLCAPIPSQIVQCVGACLPCSSRHCFSKI
jgi:hypothetical protein